MWGWAAAWADEGERFRFGIAYGAGSDNHDPEVAAAMAEIGVDLARGHVNWARVQPADGTWDWDSADAIIAAHRPAGIEVQFLLSGAPDWAWAREREDGEHGGSIPPRDDAWRAWCRALAERYRGVVRLYEIWNEPDIGFWHGTTDEYLALLRSASEEIRAADPEALVLTGGFAQRAHPESKPDMIRRVLAESAAHFDRIAYHRHGDFPEFAAEIDGILIPLQEATGTGDKPIHFTETAMDTRYGERFQAATLVKKAAFAKARRATAYTWFNFRDFPRATSPTDPGATYGLFTKDGAPKESAGAYRVLIDLLEDTEPAGQLPLADGSWAFVFSKAGFCVVVGWTEGGGVLDLAIASPAPRLRTVDLPGASTALTAAHGLVPFRLSPTPAYLVIEDEGRPLPDFRTVLAQPSGTGIALANPLDQSISVALRWEAEGTLTVADAPASVTLQPVSVQVVTADIEVADGHTFHYPDSATVSVRYRFEGTPWAGALPLTIAARTVPLPTAPLPDGLENPQFLLGTPDQVENLAERDPFSTARRWSGWHDLHAKVWIAYHGGELLVKVARKDDTWAPGDTTVLTFASPDSARISTLEIPPDRPAATFRHADQSTQIPAAWQGDGEIRSLQLRLPQHLAAAAALDFERGVPIAIQATDDEGAGPESRLRLRESSLPIPRWPILQLR
ncbi:hypothetical protein BH23VER1_BH23VER1_13260 [soil metagenome]